MTGFSPTPRRRTPRAIAGALVGLAVISSSLVGCDNKNELAFQVAGKGVTIAELDKAVAAGRADKVIGETARSKGSAYRLIVLSQLIQQSVIQQIAAKQKITFSEAELDKFDDSLFGDANAEEIQASLLQQGTLLSKDQVDDIAKQFYVGSVLAKRSAGKTEQQLITEAIAAAKKSAIDAAETAKKAGPTYDVTYISLQADKAAAAKALVDLKAKTTTIEALGKTLEPITGQDGSATAQPSTAQLPQATMKTELGTQFGAAKVGAFIQIGDATRGYIVLRVDKITQPAPAVIPPQAQLQTEAESTVAQNLLKEGQTLEIAQSKKISIWVNPRLGKLERPTSSLPSIGSTEPSTFELPAAEKAAKEAAEQAAAAQQSAAQQQQQQTTG